VQTVLWTLTAVSFLLLGYFTFRSRRVPRGVPISPAVLERHESEVLEAVREFIAASRVSAHDVLRSLDAALRRADAVDAVIVFEIAGSELQAVYTSGERASSFANVRVRIDGHASPATRAASAGHRITLGGEDRPLIASDRYALAMPFDALPKRYVVHCSAARAPIERFQMLGALIEQCAAPFALARDRETDRERATFDGLTGLLTPRAFRTMLAEEISTAAWRAPVRLALWFVDTDHFKRVNDTRGHAAGDVVLARMAALLNEHAIPHHDQVARNGGDEFCAVLRGASKSTAILRAQAFCNAVRATDFGAEVAITASVGVAAYPVDASSANELLEIADGAMYHSKRTGRDGVSYAAGQGRFERFADQRSPIPRAISVAHSGMKHSTTNSAMM